MQKSIRDSKEKKIGNIMDSKSQLVSKANKGYIEKKNLK